MAVPKVAAHVRHAPREGRVYRAMPPSFVRLKGKTGRKRPLGLVLQRVSGIVRRVHRASNVRPVSHAHRGHHEATVKQHAHRAPLEARAGLVLALVVLVPHEAHAGRGARVQARVKAVRVNVVDRVVRVDRAATTPVCAGPIATPARSPAPAQAVVNGAPRGVQRRIHGAIKIPIR